MKTRDSFVTNSSSSSFLIANISSEEKTLKDFFIAIKEDIKSEWRDRIYDLDFHKQFPTAQDFFNKVLDDAEQLCDKPLRPYGCIIRECGDHPDEDGYAEYFIYMYDLLESSYDDFSITELESHH